MYESKIVSVELINFMAIKHGKVIFDESGIINLKGYNHSGKSAVLRGIAVCLTNYKPRMQTDFIHHGEDYFRIIISFDDKVVIVRDKYKNGQSLYEMYRDGEKVFSTKQGNKLLKVSSVPDVIANYLGLVETERGCLNIQFRSDPLWLIDTKGSENYEDLGSILRMVEISRASALINTDKNKYVSTVSRLEGDLQAAKISLESYADLQENLLILLSERGVGSVSLLGSQDSLLSLEELANSIKGIKSIPEVEEVDSSQFSDLQKLHSTSVRVNSLTVYPKVDAVESSDLQKLKGMLSRVESLKKLESSCFGDLKLDGISTNEIKSLNSLLGTAMKLYDCYSELSNIDKQSKRCEKGRDKIFEMAKKEGVKFVVCKNCGTLMEVKNSG